MDDGPLRALSDAEDAIVLRDLVGHADPLRLADRLESALAGTLGPPVRCVFAELSVGLVAGLELEDGRRVVAKLHGPRGGREQLESVVRIQDRLHGEGFPAPAVLAGPLPLDGAHLMVEELVDRGEPGDPRDPAQRALWAATLHDLVDRLTGFEDLPGLPREDLERDLWPRPHSALFDVEASVEGAAPIDRVAREAVATGFRHGGRRVVGHGD